VPLDGARQGAPEAVQVADRWHVYHNLSEDVEKAVARHRACPEEPAPEPEPEVPEEAAGGQDAPDLQQAAAAAAARRAEDSALAVRTRQRYEQVQALKARGKGIKPIMRETGLAKETVRRLYYAGAVDELLAKEGSRQPFAGEPLMRRSLACRRPARRRSRRTRMPARLGRLISQPTTAAHPPRH
jgi:hypothetical protein